jgi:hypothetical protein
MRPVPHSAELPVPKPPTNMTLGDSESGDEDVSQANNNMYCDPYICISVGLQIRELVQGKQFDEDMNEIERNAWLSFKRICNDLFEITKQQTIRMLCRIC